MAHEDEGHDHGKYLTSEELVDTVYTMLKDGKLDDAVSHLKSLGDDNVVVNSWVGLQCDINNVQHDPHMSAEIARKGIEYTLEKGYKLPAAMMLHNISAFFMPNFDEGVTAEDAKLAVEAAREAIPLRKDIGDEGPLMWAYWDLGCAEMASGNWEAAIDAFIEGKDLAKTQEGTGEAWCTIFIGKAKVKHIPEKREEWDCADERGSRFYK